MSILGINVPEIRANGPVSHVSINLADGWMSD